MEKKDFWMKKKKKAKILDIGNLTIRFERQSLEKY